MGESPKRRDVERPKTDMTVERVDELLAALRPVTEEGRIDYFQREDDPEDVDERFIHHRLLWNWEEYDTFDGAAQHRTGRAPADSPRER